tara:strand:+ start:5358 stop:5663 length:306 start_codon:yes stop_codon:yes gene_type:complete
MKFDPLRPTYVSDEPDGTITVTTVQDAQPIIEEAKADSNAYGSPLTPGKQRHGMRVATIPFNVFEMWMKETNGAIQKDPKLLKKYLNDPDNKYFRTTPTRI